MNDFFIKIGNNFLHFQSNILVFFYVVVFYRLGSATLYKWKPSLFILFTWIILSLWFLLVLNDFVFSIEIM